MSEKKTNYVDGAKFFEHCVKHGFTPEAGNLVKQAGFIKVIGPVGHNIYVAATKSVGRVDLSVPEGVAFTGAAIKDLRGEKFGNVRQQLDFTQDEAAVLAAFDRCLTQLKGFKPVEKKARAAKGGNGKPEAKGWPASIPVQTKGDRKRLIEETAKKLGVKVSPKTVAEIAAEAKDGKGAAPAHQPIRAAADK